MAAHTVGAPLTRVFLLLLAAALMLTSCNTPPPLEQAAVVSARGPAQAKVAAILDRSGLRVLGEVHDAACTPGDSNLLVHDNYWFFCYTREVRVVELPQTEVDAAIEAADQATSAVCARPMRLLSDPASKWGKQTLPRAAQLGCADFILDVWVSAPDDASLRSYSLFHAPLKPGQITAPQPPGLAAARRAGSRYVLCLLGRKEFYRKMR